MAAFWMPALIEWDAALDRELTELASKRLPPPFLAAKVYRDWHSVDKSPNIGYGGSLLFPLVDERDLSDSPGRFNHRSVASGGMDSRMFFAKKGKDDAQPIASCHLPGQTQKSQVPLSMMHADMSGLTDKELPTFHGKVFSGKVEEGDTADRRSSHVQALNRSPYFSMAPPEKRKIDIDILQNSCELPIKTESPPKKIKRNPSQNSEGGSHQDASLHQVVLEVTFRPSKSGRTNFTKQEPALQRCSSSASGSKQASEFTKSNGWGGGERNSNGSLVGREPSALTVRNGFSAGSARTEEGTSGSTLPASLTGFSSRSALADKGKAPADEERSTQVRSEENDLWTSKHRPRKIADLVGNGAQIQRLKEWLVRWETRYLYSVPGGSSNCSGRGKSSADEKKAALLYGGPGIGKTSTATIVCKELGYDVVEVNASDSRGKSDKDVKGGINGLTANIVKELVTNRSLPHGSHGQEGKRVALIMDEVDGMSGGDRGGIQELIQTIHRSKIPVICICNDKYNPKLKSLVNHCMELSFVKPTKQQVSKRLASIARFEGLQTDERTLELLLEDVQCDIRLAINHLQFLRKGSRTLTFEQVRQDSKGGMKDLELSPFTVADRLLSGACRGTSLDSQINLVFQDSDLVPLLIQENYLNFRPSTARGEGERMDQVLRSADAIAAGDLVSKAIWRSQRWELMPFACVESGVAPASYVRGSREALVQGERNFNRFTALLGKNSSMGKCRRLLGELQTHMLVAGNSPTARGAVRQDYMPILAQRLTRPLKERQKEGADEVVELMEEYCLTREDRDAILEMNTLKGMRDLQEGIGAPVKSHLTRLLTQLAASRAVRASCMLPDAIVGKSRCRGEPSGGIGAVDNDVVAVQDAQPLEGEAGEEDGEMQEGGSQEGVIPGVKRKGGTGQAKGDAAKSSRSGTRRGPKAGAGGREGKAGRGGGRGAATGQEAGSQERGLVAGRGGRGAASRGSRGKSI